MPPYIRRACMRASLSIGIKGKLKMGQGALFAYISQLIDDRPELTFGLFDQTIHAATDIKQDGYLDPGLLIGGGRRVTCERNILRNLS